MRPKDEEPMLILDLVLTYKWYDMIVSGEKREEYRNIKKWLKRILSKPYTHVRFRRGYTSTATIYRIDGIACGMGRTEWGAPADERVVIIRIGERYRNRNILKLQHYETEQRD